MLLFHVVELNFFCKAPLICYLAGNGAIQMTTLLLLLLLLLFSLRYFAVINRAWYGTWNGMEDDFSMFHTGNFLPFHFHSIPKIYHSIFHSILKFSSIFHSILKFSSIFHSILPYQRNFRLEAMQRRYILLLCAFAVL